MSRKIAQAARLRRYARRGAGLSGLLVCLLVCLVAFMPESARAAGRHSGKSSGKAVKNAEKAGGDRELTALLAQVEATYGRMRSLECAFRQKSRSGGRLREGAGTAVFFRPAGTDLSGSVIRWEYSAPEAQTVINDGREVRIYTPAAKQVLVSSGEALDADLAYALFTGRRRISETFRVDAADPRLHLDPEPKGMRAMLLTPKEPQSQLQRAQIWVNPEGRIERIVMEDYFEAVTELTFSDLRFDAIKADDKARVEALRALKTPSGVEVIRQ